MGDKVNDKVAIATSDLQWAQESFGFQLGKSTLSERLKALEQLVGNQAEVIRLSGLPASTYKSVIARDGDMASERIGALARGTGLSLHYLVYGDAIASRDFACEEKRYDLAVLQFTIPSANARRQARLSVIAEQREKLDEALRQTTQLPQYTDELAAKPKRPPDGYTLITPLRPTVHLSNGGYYSTAEPAPFALSLSWFDERRLSTDRIRHLTIFGDEGGAGRPPGSIVLLDVASREPETGAVFAMDIGGEAQLRRLVRRRNGQVELQHVNPDWPAEPLASGDAAPILGREIALFRPA